MVGCGQAGRVFSHELRSERRERLALERVYLVECWQTGRWDSLTLLSPNRMTRLPGQHYESLEDTGEVLPSVRSGREPHVLEIPLARERA
jgi:putative flavoprotein involved in K+ transport